MIEKVDRKERIYTIVTIGALICMTVFMLVFASEISFWFDELDWTIGIISGKTIFNDRLFTPMFRILWENVYNLPLYYVIMKPLYELLPYGETFLLIPSILFVILGIIITGKTGKIIGGIDTGFFTVCIAVSSAILITQGGWELRPYSITFCFSSLALLMYIRRLKTETNKNILLYGISLVLLLFCHWFGSITALFYAFTDLYLYIRKKISLKCIFAYILAGILFLPWFLMVVFHHSTDLFSYWAEVPRFSAPIRTVSYLLSDTKLYCLLFGIGFILILLKNIWGNKKETPNVSKVWLFVSISILWTILPVYIYSKFINQNGSLYVDKYFFVIMPHIFLITAYGFSKTFYDLQRSFFYLYKQKKYLYCITIALFCFTLFKSYQKTLYPWSQPYRETAEYLSQDRQAFSTNSLIICSYGSGWIEYYFNKRGLIIPDNVVAYDYDSNPTPLPRLFIDKGQYIQPILLSTEDILKYDRLYLFEVHGGFKETFINTIQQNYMLVDENPEFNPSVPKTNFIKRVIKKILRIHSDNNNQLHGLRIYEKT